MVQENDGGAVLMLVVLTGVVGWRWCGYPGVHGDSAIYGDGTVRSKDSMGDHGSRDDGIMDSDVLLFRMV